MKALSIEEIKQLQCDNWVWVVDKDDAYRSGEEPCGEYYKVSSSINHHYLEVSSNGTNNYYKFYYEDYCKTWLAYKNKEQAECKGELVELPRIIHPNELEWFVQYQYPSGIINDEIFYSLEKAEQKLKELRGENG